MRACWNLNGLASQGKYSLCFCVYNGYERIIDGPLPPMLSAHCGTQEVRVCWKIKRLSTILLAVYINLIYFVFWLFFTGNRRLIDYPHSTHVMSTWWNPSGSGVLKHIVYFLHFSSFCFRSYLVRFRQTFHDWLGYCFCFWSLIFDFWSLIFDLSSLQAVIRGTECLLELGYAGDTLKWIDASLKGYDVIGGLR